MPEVSVSEKPWSDYKESDYSIEQWHNACLMHFHDGPPTSKAQCKLPVRTPDGTLNRNGVHAAAAALAGARGGVNASPLDKTKATKALAGLYKKLGEELPDSLKHSWLGDFLAHHGVKGMKWGVRRSQAQLDSSSSSEDAQRASAAKAKASTSGLSSLSNKEMQDLVTRLNLEQNYSRLTSKPSKLATAQKVAKTTLDVGNTVNQAVTFVNSPTGKFLRKAIEQTGKKGS